ncbi:MAG: CdaR family protein [Proteobacteria bacterium]|nr:CdaR family protein [Pseudomonadota bacterium]
MLLFPTDSWLNVIFSRFWLKLASLALALLVWLFVQSKEMVEVSSTVDVKLVPGKNFAVGGPNTIDRDVTIRGPRGLMASLGKEPLKATIYLPKSLGTKRLRIEKTSFDREWDQRISLIIHNPYFSVKVEEKISKTLPIKVVVQGVPHDGYYVEKIEAKPSNVTLSGAKSFLSELKHISTKPLSVDNLKSYTTRELMLNIPDDVATMFSENKTIVSVSVEEEKVNQRFAEIPIQVLSTEKSFYVQPKSVSITLQGHLSVLKKITPTQLRVFVYAQDLTPGSSYELEVQVQIPHETTLIETTPKNVTLFFK